MTASLVALPWVVALPRNRSTNSRNRNRSTNSSNNNKWLPRNQPRLLHQPVVFPDLLHNSSLPMRRVLRQPMPCTRPIVLDPRRCKRLQLLREEDRLRLARPLPTRRINRNLTAA